MKPFKFSLESLRTLRQQKERVAQQLYARSLAAREAADVELHGADRALAAAREALLGELAGGAAAGAILSRRAWCSALEARRHDRQAALDEAGRATERALRDMLAAARHREALDRFCDKSRRAHERGRLRAEQNSFDELAVQGSGSNGRLQLAGHTP